MKKKGFTLIELLAVIALLGVTTAILYPNVTKRITKAKQEAFSVQEKDIKKAASSWALKNSNLLPMQNDEQMIIYLRDLKKSGLIDQDLVNAKTKKKFKDDMQIVITRKNNKYIYEVLFDSGTQIDESIEQAPSLYLKGLALEYVEVKTKYQDKGVVGLYSDGTKISNDQIVMTPNTIETNQLGKHTIQYSVSVSGKKTSIQRTVIVRDTTPPTLTVPPNTVIRTTLDDYDVKAGVTALDNYDGDVTNRITATSGLVTHIPGVYVITYRVKDSHGNERIKKRTITVVDEFLSSFIQDLGTKGVDGAFVDPYGNVRYRGNQNIKNYVMFNGEKWRIIGVFNGNVKIIKDNRINQSGYSWSYTNKNDWMSSDIYQHLNTTYYNTLSSQAKKMIEDSKYYLGSVNSVSNSVKYYYENEREMASTGNEKNTWTGKIGLAYPSDYGYAAGNVAGCFTNSTTCTSNWMNKGYQEWSMTPIVGGVNLCTFHPNGKLVSVSASSVYMTRPVLYLKSNIKITGGTGSSTDPYKII